MKHVHAEVIHAFADGAKVQVRLRGAEHWQETRFPDFADECEYRIKPELAAPKWPQTTMTDEQIEAAAYRAPLGAQWRGIANSALRHACETGQVVPADKVREIEAKARAEGVKEFNRNNVERDRMLVQVGIDEGWNTCRKTLAPRALIGMNPYYRDEALDVLIAKVK